MELNYTKDLLIKRKNVGFIVISSKKDNYKISSVDISEYENNENKNKDDENCAKFEKNMLKYFSYEIMVNRDIELFFDFETCKQELGIDINGVLPIPYLITINIIDKEAIKKNYYFKIIDKNIKNQNNKIFDIILEKADCSDNDDFVIFQSKDYYNAYFIVHKYEEDWKKFCLYREKMESDSIVIIPTYNRARLLNRSLTSVLNQTYKNIEIIIVDDGSIDNTKKIIYKLNDNRIKYIKLKKNNGPSYARNFGIKKSKGEFISFQDSDDIYNEKKSEKQIKNLKRNNSDLDF